MSEWSRKRLTEKAKDWRGILDELDGVNGLTSLAINPDDFLIAGHGDNSLLICSKGDCTWDREYPTGEPLRTFLEDMATHTREGHMSDDTPDGGHEEYSASMVRNSLISKVKEERAAELRDKVCTFSCLADGMNYPECPVHGQGICRHDPRVIDFEGDQYWSCLKCGLNMGLARKYPYPDGDVMVLGPELFIDADHEVIAYQGQHYQRMIPPQDPETLVATDEPVNKPFMRQLSMEWAVKLNLPERASLRDADDGLIETAQRIYDWMTEK